MGGQSFMSIKAHSLVSMAYRGKYGLIMIETTDMASDEGVRCNVNECDFLFTPLGE